MEKASGHLAIRTHRMPAETAAAAASESQPDNVVPSRNFCDPRRLLFGLG